ncbi:MAG: antitoxin VapB family protein, partial [Methanobacteriota archaeon]
VTKTVSLADDAYEALARVKLPEESFSDLARRLARMAAQERIFAPSDEPPLWTEEEAEEEKRRIYRERDASLEPRYREDPG